MDIKELIRLIRKLDVAAHQGPRHVEQQAWEDIRKLIDNFPVEPEPKPTKESK